MSVKNIIRALAVYWYPKIVPMYQEATSFPSPPSRGQAPAGTQSKKAPPESMPWTPIQGRTQFTGCRVKPGMTNYIELIKTAR